MEAACYKIKSSSGRDDTDEGIQKNEEITTTSAELSARPTSCIWTKDELEVFRDGYFELKKKSVNLLLMLSTAKSQNKKLKKIYRNKESVIQHQNGILSEQKKQIMKLNTTITEIRKDLNFSNQELHHYIETEAQLKDQVSFLKTELDEERKELLKARQLCSGLRKSLQQHQKEAAFGLTQQENVFEAKFLHMSEKLEEQNKALNDELQEERCNHGLTKVALKQLRRHFANMQTSGSAPDFLDVAETSSYT